MHSEKIFDWIEENDLFKWNKIFLIQTKYLLTKKIFVWIKLIFLQTKEINALIYGQR